MVCKQVIYSGHVQGVGFRYKTHRIAGGYSVSGFVKNLPDGTVEVIVQGEENDVEGFMREVSERIGNYIRDVKINDAPRQYYSGFTIQL